MIVIRAAIKLACAFGAMAAPAFAGWLWSQVTYLEAAIVILVIGVTAGAACMHGFAAIDRREA